MNKSVDLTPAYAGMDAGNGKPGLRGIHHLALVTEDMKGTLDFYVRVLRMPLVHALTTAADVSSAHGKGAPPFRAIPHLFLDMGGDSLLAFFEYPKGGVGPADRDRLGAMQHVSFACGKKRFHETLERVKAAGVAIVGGPVKVIDPAIHSFYFFDPVNGTRLEIVADFDGDEHDLRLVRSVDQDEKTLREELAKVSDDPAWIDEMIATRSR
ncbi:MAG TPA: VOC family protein [Burkholderiales bacterium]|jgi:catechol 2,3-dioxygenase-like lactoylglutathione lyase family enzyme|nr:VOC family protein [Burkholderiales bacterium]